MQTDAELHGELLAELSRLRRAAPEIRGCLVASTDGMLIADDADAVVAEGVAALSAACLGVSQRIAECAGHTVFEEIVIRSAGGYVAMYMAGQHAVLVMLADSFANVGRLNHEARRSTGIVGRAVDAAINSPAETVGYATALPERRPHMQDAVPW